PAHWSRRACTTGRSRPPILPLCQDQPGRELYAAAPCPDRQRQFAPTACLPLCGERMLDLGALGDHLGNLWLTGYRAGVSFFGGAVIEILNFLIVGRFPVDENADTNEKIFGFVLRDYSFSHAVRYSLGNRMLRRAKHLHSLLRALDRNFVEQHRRRFTQQVRRHHCQQRCKSILVVRQTICKGRFGGASARPHDKVNVRDLIAVTHKRFTNAKSTNFCHRHLLPRKHYTFTDPTTKAGGTAILVVSIRNPDRLAR